MMGNIQSIRLSPTVLNLFLECPRCFWLEKKKGIKRPRGIFPSLPGGMDLVIKKYFDSYRTNGKLPPEIEGKVEGKLFPDRHIIDMWRNWRKSDLCHKDEKINAVLIGALDDCLVDGNEYIPLDYKTRGSALRDDPRKYYQTQLDCYCLMLNSRGYKTKGLAYLLYYWPKSATEGGIVSFEVQPIKIETDICSAKRIFEEAATLLSSKIPPPSSTCEFCNLVEKRRRE